MAFRVIRGNLLCKWMALLVAMALLLPGGLFHPSRTLAAGGVTIDSHSNGSSVPVGIVRLTGTYTTAYDIKLFINAEKRVDVHMDDPNGDDSGTWYYDLDTSLYDGGIEIVALGTETVSRYGIWSPFVNLQVDNAAVNIPAVSIRNPSDGASVSGSVPVQVSVQARNPVSFVQVRVNGGQWRPAIKNGSSYVFNWNTAGNGDKTCSIEARAVDSMGNTGRSLTTYANVGKGTHEQGKAAKQDRAMWIWELSAYNLLLNPGSRTVLDAMAKDTATFNSNPITTLYFAVGQYGDRAILDDDPAKVRNFISWAHNKGYKVQALIAGNTTPAAFGAYSRYHDRAIRLMEQLINYNIASGSNEKFDGVNVDIEPYIVPEFATQGASIQTQYLDGLSKMIQRRNVSGLFLPFGPAIPKWFDSQIFNLTWNGSTKVLSQHVQDISDYIAIMDYRDTADGPAGVIQGAKDEIDYANAIGKRNSVIIGVETLDIADGGDPATITFREEGRTYMEGELRKVYAAYGGNAAFGGIAMHHYDSILALPSDWSQTGSLWTPPADSIAPSAVKADPEAAAFDYQRIDLHYGTAYDNRDVDHYNIYRGAATGFTPGPSNLAGTAKETDFQDIGLLPGTTYYYKVAAVDARGNIGPVSGDASATTGTTTLKPMIIDGMSVSYTGTNATVTLRIVDKQTKAGITAAVHGRFTFSGGNYINITTAPDGSASATSEAIASGLQAGFEPKRVMADGYYWAKAYDNPHTAALFTNAH